MEKKFKQKEKKNPWKDLSFIFIITFCVIIFILSMYKYQNLLYDDTREDFLKILSSMESRGTTNKIDIVSNNLKIYRFRALNLIKTPPEYLNAASINHFTSVHAWPMINSRPLYPLCEGSGKIPRDVSGLTLEHLKLYKNNILEIKKDTVRKAISEIFVQRTTNVWRYIWDVESTISFGAFGSAFKVKKKGLNTCNYVLKTNLSTEDLKHDRNPDINNEIYKHSRDTLINETWALLDLNGNDIARNNVPKIFDMFTDQKTGLICIVIEEVFPCFSENTKDIRGNYRHNEKSIMRSYIHETKQKAFQIVRNINDTGWHYLDLHIYNTMCREKDNVDSVILIDWGNSFYYKSDNERDEYSTHPMKIHLENSVKNHFWHMQYGNLNKQKNLKALQDVMFKRFNKDAAERMHRTEYYKETETRALEEY